MYSGKVIKFTNQFTMLTNQNIFGNVYSLIHLVVLYDDYYSHIIGFESRRAVCSSIFVVCSVQTKSVADRLQVNLKYGLTIRRIK